MVGVVLDCSVGVAELYLCVTRVGCCCSGWCCWTVSMCVMGRLLLQCWFCWTVSVCQE